MRMAFAIGIAALLLAAPVFAQPAAMRDAHVRDVPAAPDYSADSSWLCRPGRPDPCALPLPTAALNPDGYGATGFATPAADPPIDCFYVYPTVSRDPGDNSDLDPGIEEKGVATVQFGRFAGLCRPYA